MKCVGFIKIKIPFPGAGDGIGCQEMVITCAKCRLIKAGRIIQVPVGGGPIIGEIPVSSGDGKIKIPSLKDLHEISYPL